MEPTPVFLPREFHGQRSLASYISWSRKESDITERLIVSLSRVISTKEGDTSRARASWR